MEQRLYQEPDVSVFVPCPHCRRLLPYDVQQCSHCCELVDDEDRVSGAVYTVVVTQAVSVANNLVTLDPAVVLFVLLTAFAVLSGWGQVAAVYILVGAMALHGTGRWLIRYGRFHIAEEEFVAARRRMWQSFAMWLAFLFFEIALAVYVFTAP